MSSIDMSEFMGVFIDEVEEQLQVMDEEILALEQNGESEEIIQKLFRAAHTLKGSSATMGFKDMSTLTHGMENLLDLVRNNRLSVSGELIDLLFKCLDELRVLKDELVSEGEITTDITPMIQEVQAFAAGEGNGPGKNQVRKSAPAGLMFSPEAKQKARTLKQEGYGIFQIEVGISADCEMKSVRSFLVYNQLQSKGEIIQAIPSVDSMEHEDEQSFEKLHYLVATHHTGDEMKEFLLSITDVETADAAPFSTDEPKEAKKPEQPKTAPSVDKKPKQAEGRQRKQTIRVDVDRLEHLMNLVGELVIDQTRISQLESQLRSLYHNDETVKELGQTSDHIARVIGELQENVMKIRMLPIDQLFSRYPRMVRDLSQKLNKDIGLVIEGKETELDRTVIEKIGDPLIHLIRNALDHGIESKEERIKKNKPEKGLLRIAAGYEENQVVITIEDDGAGIDPEKMRKSSVKKGIISQEEAEKLTDEEAAYLIFRPGFSTAKSVSDVSGRGVGMDIVRTHIEELNGIVELDSKLGRGTKITIKLPLTLAIITGLLVRLAERTFIVPMSNVIEIVRINPASIKTIQNKSIIPIRDQVLPVVWLYDLFHLKRPEFDDHHLIPLVIVGIGEKRLAFVVDELYGNQEIVVKSLGKYVGKIEGFSGATLLGDGRVELILDIAGISRMANSQ
jgi:two-component system chemotaxis sensor kinase CheA